MRVGRCDGSRPVASFRARMMATRPGRRGERRRLVLALASLVAFVSPSNAGPLDWIRSWRATSDGFSQQDLSTEMTRFAERATAAISGAADRISDEAQTRPVRRRALLWKVRLTPVFRDAALQQEPLQAFADSLLAATAMYGYLKQGDGREAFGALQPVALETAEELLASLADIARRFLKPAQLERATAEAQRLAAQGLISGPDFATGEVVRVLTRADTTNAFQWILDVPLVPFRALGGVESGAAAIRDFDATAERFASIVEQIPQQLRWQTELLMFEIEDRDTTVETLAALTALAESSQRATQTLEQLRTDLDAVLDGSGERLAGVDRVLARAEQVAVPLENTAQQLQQASAAWAEVLKRDPEQPPGRPFDVREWQETAAEIGSGAEQLRRLIEEVRALGAAPELSGLLGGADATVARARRDAEALVDYAMWRVLALLVAFFALLLGYRVLSSRMIGTPRG